MEPQEDDVIEIGKLRRKGYPGAPISYDPGHGIRIADENVPLDPADAAAWCRRSGGWLRVKAAAKESKSVGVQDFLRAWRNRG